MAGLEDLYARGLISDDALNQALDRLGPPQRQSRSDILQSGLDRARDYLTPSYLRDTPSSPQADQALADPNARPGKIGPPSGPPTTAQMIGGVGADVASNALPWGKLSGGALAKWLAAIGIPWKPAEVETLRKMVNAGALDMDQLPGRTKSAAINVMSKLGLSLSESPNYVAQGAIRNDPERTGQLMEMLAKGGKSQAQMADELGVSERTVRRYMTDELDVRASRGTDWNDPERIEAYKTMAGQGWSVRQMGNSLGINEGTVSRQLAKMREAGHLPDYAPMGGTRTPSMPQLKSQGGPAPDLDAGRDFAKALAAFMPQYR